MRRFLIIPALLACTLAGAQTILSLEDCLRMSGNGNPGIRNARLGEMSAKAMKKEMTWEFFPTVSVTGIGYQASRPLINITLKDVLGSSDAAWELNNKITALTNENGIHNSYTSFSHGATVGILATQPIYAGGRVRNGNRLASIGVEAASLQADIKERDTREDIEKKFWQVVALQEKMTTLCMAKASLDSIYRDVKAAADAGLVATAEVYEVSHARTELASGEIALKGGLKLAKMDLFNAIGMQYEYLKLDGYTLAGDAYLNVSPDQVAADDSTEPAEKELLDIQVEAKKLEKKVAVGEFLPEVAIGASCGYNSLAGNKPGNFTGLGFASVKVPLTGIGKAAARSRRYDYAIQQAVNEKEYFDSQLELQKRQLFLAMETAFSQAGVALEALREAEAAERRCRADYNAGRTATATLLKAEVETRTARETYIDRLIDYKLAVCAYRGRYQ